MFVWQTLVPTPVISLWRMQASRPASVRVSTLAWPRRSSLTISVPSMLTSGVTLPSARSFARDLVGDELAVGEDLEVAVGVRCEHVEQLRVHERLAAEDAEEAVAHASWRRRSAGPASSAGIISRGPSTSTQQPWQRRLQLLMIEM